MLYPLLEVAVCEQNRALVTDLGHSSFFIKKKNLEGFNLLLLMLQVSLIYNSIKSRGRFSSVWMAKAVENHDTKISGSHCSQVFHSSFEII